VETLTVYFTGEHEKVLISAHVEEEEGAILQEEEEVAKEVPPDIEAYPSSEEEQQEQLKDFTELDRLVYVVRSIEHECQTVPVGAVKLLPNHELRRNRHFQGLTREQAKDLQNYMHFRNVQTTEKREMLDRDDAIFRADILDPLHWDFPKGAWSL